jgi:hypothetical protein
MRYIPAVTIACYKRLHWLCALLHVDACECRCHR